MEDPTRDGFAVYDGLSHTNQMFAVGSLCRNKMCFLLRYDDSRAPQLNYPVH